jgi:hypothetical protein
MPRTLKILGFEAAKRRKFIFIKKIKIKFQRFRRKSSTCVYKNNNHYLNF